MTQTFKDVFTEFTEGYVTARGGTAKPELRGIIPETYIKDLYPDFISYDAVVQPLFDLIAATAPGGKLYHLGGWDAEVNHFYMESQKLFYAMERSGLRDKIQEVYLNDSNMRTEHSRSYLMHYNHGANGIKNYMNIGSVFFDMNIEIWDTLFCYGMETIRLYQEPHVVDGDMMLTDEDSQWFAGLLDWFNKIYRFEIQK